MKMRDLMKYDLPEAVTEMWAREESESLLPLQEMAVRRYGLFEGGNLVIQAPTSSGKTFVGEMAALQTALRQKKVVYLAPLKALAEEKYRSFQAKYGAYGLKVIVSSRDHREHDQDLESGNFSIAVVVYEKLAQLLVRRPERLAEIELVVADELEILSDPERGATAELLLTRILQAGQRIIGLSAVIGGADRLAAWLGGALLRYERRPVELRYGVLHEGRFQYRTYNDQCTGEEALAWAGGESPWEEIVENVVALAGAGEPCLVFVKAKHESRRGAELLAERLSLPGAVACREALEGLDETRTRNLLLETVGSGVAFHNADMSPEERQVVEAGFRQGELRVLVSTSTLAIGLNLPARNVFVSPEKWRYDQRLDMPWKTPILRTEYENMSGRAGRYGAGYDFGRALLVAATPFEADTYWRRYVEGERESIAPRLAREPLEDHVLRLVASRSCSTVAELQDFLEQTLSGQWIWREEYTLEEVEIRIRAALNRCMALGMVEDSETTHLRPTALGLAVASKGIAIDTAAPFQAWLEETSDRNWHPLELLLVTALSPCGRALPLTLSAWEFEQADYPTQLRSRFREDDADWSASLARFGGARTQLFFEELRAVKAALVLDAWIESTPLTRIEERYHTMAGQILATGEHVSWLCDALAAVAEAMGIPAPRVAAIATLAARLQWGVEADALPLATAQLPGMNRTTLIRLGQDKLLDAQALAAQPESMFARYVEQPALGALMRWAKEQQQQEDSVMTTENKVSVPPAPMPVLLIDGNHPDRILIDGQAVRLQEKQFRLISCLAARPNSCVPYETIYQEVWGEVVVEDNQMHFQKRKLLKAIKEHCPDRAPLVKTVPKRGFCLELAADEIELRPVARHAAA